MFNVKQIMAACGLLLMAHTADAGGIDIDGPTTDEQIWVHASFPTHGDEASGDGTIDVRIRTGAYVNTTTGTTLGSKIATEGEDEEDWETDEFVPPTGGWPVGPAHVFVVEDRPDPHADSFDHQNIEFVEI